MRPLPDPPVLVITDRHQAVRPLTDIAESVFQAGCRWLSVRDRDLPARDRRKLAAEIAGIGARYGAVVGVHDDTFGFPSADAFHLSSKADIEKARSSIGGGTLIGFSAHNPDEVSKAERAGADYATISPVFLTSSKPGHGPAIGLDGLSALAAGTTLPLITLAGVDASNARDCLAAGASGIAVMGAIMRSQNAKQSMQELIAAAF